MMFVENYFSSVYVGGYGGYGGLSESGLCIFRKLCPVGFFVACKFVGFVTVYSHVC